VGKYNKVVPFFLDALRSTEYFDMFYVVSDDPDGFLPGSLRIPLEEDLGWSNNIIKGLQYVSQDVFFMGCEDHVLVDFEKLLIDCAYEMVTEGKYGCVRLTKKPKIPRGCYDKSLTVAEIDPSYKYLVSLQPTVWSKKYLEKIIRPGESAWQFEVLASQRARELDIPVGVTYKTAFNYRNTMDKGEANPDTRTYTEIHGT